MKRDVETAVDETAKIECDWKSAFETAKTEEIRGYSL